MVIQQRAICDVRDCIKPSARQLMYAQLLDKIDWKHKYQKSLKSVGSGSSHFYIHGDASAYGTLIRMGKPFTMRYPLEDVSGNYGTRVVNGDEAASRYTEMRLHSISSYLFDLLDKDTIDRWIDNYDNTEKYPAVLPSLGYYNIVNGTTGIGVALASSIPQFNLTEVNNALITLLNNPNADFEDVYCPPDFATGGFLMNESEVKESLRVGVGKACKLRAPIDYDEKTNSLIVSEVPYGVFTNTVCKQMAQLLEENKLPGVESFIDLTKTTPNIEIKLTKTANPGKVIRLLYKQTALQYHYGINMVMLDNGTTPKIFGWKEALSAHLQHEKIVLKNSLLFDMAKYKAREHILDGLLIAIASIEDVIATIKSSKDSTDAKNRLIKQYGFDEIQAKAILDIKLVRLANLEAVKIQNERDEIQAKIDDITDILGNEKRFNQQIEDKLKEVISKFGDARRTVVMDVCKDNDDDSEPVERKNLIVSLSNFGNIYASETTTFITQKRGGAGSKLKLQSGEYIIETINDDNTERAMAFSNKGKSFGFNLSELPINQRSNINDFFNLGMDEKITKIVSYSKKSNKKYVVFLTRMGMIKKTDLSEYIKINKKGSQAIKLKDGDELVKILILNEEKIGILSKNGQIAIFETSTISPIGKVAMGVRGMKLDENDCICDGYVISNTDTEIISVSKNGFITRTDLEEIPITNRNVKGTKIQKVIDGDSICGFITIDKDEKDIRVISTSASIQIPICEVSVTGRSAQGVRAMKIQNNDKIVKILRKS